MAGASRRPPDHGGPAALDRLCQSRQSPPRPRGKSSPRDLHPRLHWRDPEPNHSTAAPRNRRHHRHRSRHRSGPRSGPCETVDPRHLRQRRWKRIDRSRPQPARVGFLDRPRRALHHSRRPGPGMADLAPGRSPADRPRPALLRRRPSRPVIGALDSSRNVRTQPLESPPVRPWIQGQSTRTFTTNPGTAGYDPARGSNLRGTSNSVWQPCPASSPSATPSLDRCRIRLPAPIFNSKGIGPARKKTWTAISWWSALGTSKLSARP